ncbi:MAG: MBL fold metallo-hydrolase [Syntrophomonadaceae bacterium]|nr:MBL fold metallo-hydrolase [Syntrophomonadaceae bacterium]MDD3889004.1 MBL fold metallo-hydrolase [Syntrophomonadaceae bacterium]MDD4548297.1 MBL fold metallo-hydrolase [Syntrophomonadaceae bacterium]
MRVEITILVENTTPVPKLIGEYGFAALVKTDNQQILFDTGSKDALLTNSIILGINLEKIDSIVLSHGHFDHTGALVPLLGKYGGKPIYAHSNLFARRPFKRGANNFQDIGCAFTKKSAEEKGAEFKFIDHPTEIYPHIYCSGEVPRVTDYEDVGGNFKCEANGELIDDKLIDDGALIVDHPEGLIILSGCAHSGIINMIKHAIAITGQSKVLAFIGGTHLIRASDERLAKTVTALREIDISQIIVSHCTGFYAAAKLYNELGSKVIKGETGMTFKY